MKTALILLGLLAATMIVAAPTASAHIVIGYRDPFTGECEGVFVKAPVHAWAGEGGCVYYH